LKRVVLLRKNGKETDMGPPWIKLRWITYVEVTKKLSTHPRTVKCIKHLLGYTCTVKILRDVNKE